MNRTRPAGWARLASLSVAVSLGVAAHSAALAERPRVYTNQQYIEDVTRPLNLPIDDPKAMFAIVLEGLPDRVKVYPTENYFYYWFYYNGLRYAGNIRLSVKDRDEGKVHFAYFVDWSEWMTGDYGMQYVVLDQKDGVRVERLAPLVYRVTHKEKRVVFELNDLSTVVPPPNILAPDDKYLGPVFDESAIRFFLVFNTRLKAFHYLLDETVRVPDELVPGNLSDRILIAKRTGFAFYRDHHYDRKILIGTFQANTIVNNYFDGPFDQLPDNFIKGDELRDAIIASDPSVAGQNIDRYGIWPGGGSRYLIGPYVDYRSEEDLIFVHECATNPTVTREWYHACFVPDGSAFPQAPAETEAAPAPKIAPKPLRK